MEHKEDHRLVAELELERAKLRSIINSIGDGILVLGTDSKIELYNDAAVSILGYLITDFYSRTGTFDIAKHKLKEVMILRDSNENEVDPLNKVLADKLPEVREDLWFAASDGRKTRLYTNTTPVFDEKEKVTKAILLIRDITAERELFERMEEFISVTSHELRTPVAVIEGNLSTALLPQIGKMDDNVRKFIQNAHENTIFLSKLIQDLTTLRNIEKRGLLAEELDEFYAADLIRDVVDEFKKKAEEKDLKIKIKLPKTELAPLRTSRSKLKQILVNLLDNAIKYTNEGLITIELGFDNKFKKIFIKVTDTGIGIKKEYQKKIFQRFYRGEDWRTRKTSGTGLGLYISRRVVEYLGGEISFESQEGKGSTFTILLPLTSPVVEHTEQNPNF